MIRSILPIIFILTAGSLFFSIIDPYYEKVTELRAQERQFNEALSRSEELQQVRDQLITKYNNFGTENLERLSKLLPESVDDVRLVLDVNSVARSHGMRLRDISIQNSVKRVEEQGVIISGASQEEFDSVVISFSSKTTYENLLAFLTDLERSLQLIDIVNLSIIPGDFGIDYKISLRTYWLK